MGLRAPAALLLSAAILAGSGCPEASDDDDSTVANDDDETPTPDPNPLADRIGVFNLINVVRPDGSSYVDFSGAFGTFAGIDTTTLAPGGYLGGFELGESSFRYDLGGYPVPAVGAAEVLDLADYLPWIPADETWWDGGNAVAAGNYLSSRFTWTSEDGVDSLSAYAVDDPLSPGGAAWTPGAPIGFEVAGGPDVVAYAFPDAATLPSPAVLTSPDEGATVEHPKAEDLTVEWTPQGDGATVMVALVADLGLAYLASVEDDGTHTIPASVLHDDLPGVQYELILGRDLETVLEHPQGEILFRTREEARATVQLLPDLVISPDFGEPGTIGQYTVDWFTGSWDQTTVLDLGEGITVGQSFPDPTDPERALVTITVLPDAEVGARTASIGNAASSLEQPAAFWIYNLAPLDDCSEADAFGPLPSGTYASSTSGLANDIGTELDCLDWTLNGNDAVYRIDLLEGEEFVAWLTAPEPGDGALILMEACDDPASAVACADVGYAGEFEELLFTAPRDGTWYLVVDAYTVAGYGTADLSFELTVDYGDLIPTLLDPGWMVPGTTVVQTLPGDGPWGAVQPGDVDLGADITVDAVVTGVDPTLLNVTATASPTAASGARDVSATPAGGDRTELNQSLWVTDFPSYDTCAQATASTPVTGSGTGWAVGSAADMVDAACFSWGTGGPEIFLPVDLAAGESLSVTALALDSFDDVQIYVLSDCGDPESCIVDASADDGIEGESETVTGWVPATPGRYYVGVGLFAPPFETFSPAWGYDLTLSVD